MRDLGRSYDLRVLLVLADTVRDGRAVRRQQCGHGLIAGQNDAEQILGDLAGMAVVNDYTLIVAWRYASVGS